MRGKLARLAIEGFECALYLPPDYSGAGCYYPAIYMNGSEGISDIMERLEPHFGSDCEAFILIAAEPRDWNDDFSPWPAPALTAKSKAFGGQAEAYLKFLCEKVKPTIDADYRTKPEPSNTAIVGYSLGGLAALYAMYTCPAFGRFASLSGSLWYDGWVGFMQSGTPLHADSRVYISLGRSEECGRNPRMAQVGDCTRRTVAALEQKLEDGGKLLFRLNEGGHFTDITGRHELALAWLMNPNNYCSNC